jgi:hypothetical protein
MKKKKSLMPSSQEETFNDFRWLGTAGSPAFDTTPYGTEILVSS